MNELIGRIVSGNKKLAAFRSNSHGWAPDEAATLISKSRLDWQTELSSALYLWDSSKLDNGKLILAWANLGALIEGTLKFFLSVYYLDYKNDIENIKDKKGEIVDPDELVLEKLKQFFKKRELLSEDQILFVEKVQQRRNAIHAFKDRPIGTKEEYEACLSKYLDLILDIAARLPYPDDIYGPDF